MGIFSLLTIFGSLSFYFGHTKLGGIFGKSGSVVLVLSSSTIEKQNIIATKLHDGAQDHLDCASFQEILATSREIHENGFRQYPPSDNKDLGKNGTIGDAHDKTTSGSRMVIVFLHIAKTGGTTIRSFLGQQPTSLVRTRLSVKPGDFERNSLEIQRFLRASNSPTINDANTSNTAVLPPILFVEFHGQGLDANLLPEHLHLWKVLAGSKTGKPDTSARNQITRHQPLFVFTLWRHPIDHAISYYHFLVNHTDLEAKALDQSEIYSRQCATFVPNIRPTTRHTTADRKPKRNGNRLSRTQEAKVERTTKKGTSPHHTAFFHTREKKEKDGLHISSISKVTPGQCLEVYNGILSQLDWVGATSTIDQTTLPILEGIVSARNGESTPERTTVTTTKTSIFSEIEAELTINLRSSADATKNDKSQLQTLRWEHKNIGRYHRGTNDTLSLNPETGEMLAGAICEDFVIWNHLSLHDSESPDKQPQKSDGDAPGEEVRDLRDDPARGRGR